MNLITPKPMLVGQKRCVQLVQFFWVPAKFFDDHAERCPADEGEVGICKEERRSGNRVLIYGTFRQLDNLRGDAEFYAESNVDDCAALVRSAKATLAVLDAA